MSTYTRPVIHLRDYGAELDLELGVADTFRMNVDGRTYVSMRLAIFTDSFGPILRKLPAGHPKRVMYEYVMEDYDPQVAHPADEENDPLPHCVYIDHQRVDDQDTPDDPQDDTVSESEKEFFYIARSNFSFELFYREMPEGYRPYDSLTKKDDILWVSGDRAARTDFSNVPSITDYKNDPSLVPTDDEMYPADGFPEL